MPLLSATQDNEAHARPGQSLSPDASEYQGEDDVLPVIQTAGLNQHRRYSPGKNGVLVADKL